MPLKGQSEAHGFETDVCTTVRCTRHCECHNVHLGLGESLRFVIPMYGQSRVSVDSSAELSAPAPPITVPPTVSTPLRVPAMLMESAPAPPMTDASTPAIPLWVNTRVSLPVPPSKTALAEDALAETLEIDRESLPAPRRTDAESSSSPALWMT